MMVSWLRKIAPIAACLMLIACGDEVPDQAKAEKIIHDGLQEAARQAARSEGKDPHEYLAMLEGMTVRVSDLTRDSETELTASVTTNYPGRRTKSGQMKLVKADGKWRAIIE